MVASPNTQQQNDKLHEMLSYPRQKTRPTPTSYIKTEFSFLRCKNFSIFFLLVDILKFLFLFHARTATPTHRHIQVSSNINRTTEVVGLGL